MQLGFGLLLPFSCKQALLLDDIKVVFLVFGTLLQCMVSLCLSSVVSFRLCADSGRLALGVFLNLKAEMVLSSFISSFPLDVSLKMQLLAAGLGDVIFILNWLESSAFKVGSFFVIHM